MTRTVHSVAAIPTHRAERSWLDQFHFRFVATLGLVLACSCLLLGTGSVLAQGDNELITEEDVKQIRQNNINFNKALGKDKLTQGDIAVLNEMARLQVLQMTLASKRRELKDIRERIQRDMNLLSKEASRNAILPQYVKHGTTLLNDQPLPVRLNAVMLLSQLNQQPPVIQKNLPAVPFLGIADPLLAVLQDPNQHESLKVIAAQGLKRVCEHGSPKVDLRSKIADAMIAEMKRDGIYPWYERVLIDAVSHTDVLFDKTRKPYIVQTLAEILVDPMKPWEVRAEAASGLGRTDINGEINLQLIIYEITRFSYEMGMAYNQNLKKPHWRYTAFRVYTSFKPEETGDTALLTRVQSQPFSQSRAAATAAYQESLKMVNGILKNPVNAAKPIPANDLKDVKKWVDDNKPADVTIYNGGPPIRKANANG